MNRHEDIAKELQVRLFELKRRVAEIDQELHTQLPTDSEDRASLILECGKLQHSCLRLLNP